MKVVHSWWFVVILQPTIDPTYQSPNAKFLSLSTFWHVGHLVKQLQIVYKMSCLFRTIAVRLLPTSNKRRELCNVLTYTYRDRPDTLRKGKGISKHSLHRYSTYLYRYMCMCAYMFRICARICVNSVRIGCVQEHSSPSPSSNRSATCSELVPATSGR